MIGGLLIIPDSALLMLYSLSCVAVRACGLCPNIVPSILGGISMARVSIG